MPTFAASDAGYFALWNKADVRVERVSAAASIAKRALAHKTTFMAVQLATGVPWQWIAVIAYRESDMNLEGAFANGDLIIGRGTLTHNVPAGRGPFDTWADSAIDEITRRGLNKHINWSVERMCFEAEAYNGWGYLGKCNSPYVYSYTIEYGPPQAAGGKYPRDHYWDANALDAQCGVVAILKELALIDPQTEILLSNREPIAPSSVVAEASKKATSKTRKVAGAGGTIAAGGGASEAAKHTGVETIIDSPIAFAAIGLGVVILVVGATLTVKTGNLLKARW